MSGSFVFRRGVGTQMLMVSSSFTTAKSVVASSLPLSRRVLTSAVETSGMYERPSSIACDFADVEVDAGRVEPGLGELDGQWQSDIAQSNHAGSCPAGLDFVREELRRVLTCDLTPGECAEPNGAQRLPE